jgi:hypothetical protein
MGKENGRGEGKTVYILRGGAKGDLVARFHFSVASFRYGIRDDVSLALRR